MWQTYVSMRATTFAFPSTNLEKKRIKSVARRFGSDRMKINYLFMYIYIYENYLWSPKRTVRHTIHRWRLSGRLLSTQGACKCMDVIYKYTLYIYTYMSDLHLRITVAWLKYERCCGRRHTWPIASRWLDQASTFRWWDKKAQRGGYCPRIAWSPAITGGYCNMLAATGGDTTITAAMWKSNLVRGGKVLIRNAFRRIGGELIGSAQRCLRQKRCCRRLPISRLVGKFKFFFLVFNV